MVHFFALLFWVAGGLAFLAGMPQLGVAVFVVVVLNALFWQIPLRDNRLLIGAVVAELAMLAAFLYIPPLAHLLGQSPPPPAGVLAAALAAPAVLAADTLHKRITRFSQQPART